MSTESSSSGLKSKATALLSGPRAAFLALTMALGPTLTAYFFGTLATALKTFAWWFNQWPFVQGWPFMGKWAISAGNSLL